MRRDQASAVARSASLMALCAVLPGRLGAYLGAHDAAAPKYLSAFRAYPGGIFGQTCGILQCH
jgi:hypothetical protein